MNPITEQGVPSILIQEGNFSGINARDPDNELPPGHLVNAMNLYLNPAGGLSLRLGFTQYSDLTAKENGSNVILGMGRFLKSDGSNHLVSVLYNATDGIMFWYDTLGTWAQIASLPSPLTGYSATAKWTMLMVEDLLVMYNGVDRPLMWDGDHTTPHKVTYFGVSIPTVAPTMADKAVAGTLTPGSYYWYIIAFKHSQYSLISAGLESATGHVAPAAPYSTITVTIPAQVPDPGVDNFSLYRSLGQAEALPAPPLSQFYFVADAAYTVGPTNYDDSIPDSTLTTHASFLSDHKTGILDHSVPPAKMAGATVHQNRLFAIDATTENGSLVSWSRAAHPAYFPPLYSIEIDSGSGSNLAGIVGLEPGILCLKDDRAGMIDTPGEPQNWSYRPISTHGLCAKRTLCVVQEPSSGQMVVLRLSRDGVYMCDGDRDISVGDMIWPLIRNLGITTLQGFSAYYNNHDSLYVMEGVGFLPPSGTATGSNVAVDLSFGGVAGGFIFHLRNPQHGIDGKFAGFAATLVDTSFTSHLAVIVDADQSFYGTKDTGIIYKIWTGGQDAGVDIDFLLAPRPFNSGGKFGQSRMQFFLCRAQTFGSNFDLYYNIDNIDSGIFQNLSASQYITLLDQNIYEKLPVPTLALATSGSPMATGDYFYRYQLSNTVPPTFPTLITKSSNVSNVITVTENKVVEVTLPKYDTALNKGYTKYLVYRTSVGAAADSLYRYRGYANITLNTDMVFTDTNAAWTGVLSGDPPPDELLWGTAEVKQIRIPDYGKLHAGAKGEYVRLTITGSTSDLNLRLMAIGVSMKPKAIR